MNATIKSKVKEKIIEILAMQAQVDMSQVDTGATLESLGIDSVAVVEIIFAIEEEFDITIPYNANNTSSYNLDFSKVSSIIQLVIEIIEKNKKSECEE